MLGHELAVAVDVHRLAPLLGQLDGEFDGKAVGRRERERVVRRDRRLIGQLLEALEAARERLLEPLFLGLDLALDRLGLAPQFGIGVAHLLDDDGRQSPDVREPDPLRLLHRSPDDAAQHVAATLVRRRDAVGHEERHAAAVVGEDAVRLRRGRRVAVRDAGLRGDPVHDLPVAVRVVHGHHVLEDRRAALEPEARCRCSPSGGASACRLDVARRP